MTGLILLIQRNPQSDDDNLQQVVRRLKLNLGFDISTIKAADVTQDDLDRSDLVLLHSYDDAKLIRHASVPVVALTPDVLYGLGMTGAEPSVDFGTTAGAYLAHLLQPDLIKAVPGRDLVNVVRDGYSAGWGRPRHNSIRMASYHGGMQEGRSAVFAHHRGDDMAGLKAPHRRIAFLLPSRLPA